MCSTSVSPNWSSKDVWPVKKSTQVALVQCLCWMVKPSSEVVYNWYIKFICIYIQYIYITGDMSICIYIQSYILYILYIAGIFARILTHLVDGMHIFCCFNTPMFDHVCEWNHWLHKDLIGSFKVTPIAQPLGHRNVDRLHLACASVEGPFMTHISQ